MGLRLLETLTSALYEDPIILFREYVQNSADAHHRSTDSDPSLEWDDFTTDICIDKEQSSITINDNGFGIAEDEFLSKMTSIGKSDKGKYNDQIGFRGIGRLSGMPFCERLVFTNKVKGLSKCLLFTWYGDKFHELLNQETDHELSTAIGKITTSSEVPYKGDINDHYFRVEIIGYRDEIKELVNSENFKARLALMLPLKYSPSFTKQEIIKSYYEDFMGEDLDKFSHIIQLNGEILYKPYRDNNILESDIVFWKLQYKGKTKNIPGDKIGILWFTFNRKVSTNPEGEPYGILVRSKNMLMGDNNSLADAIIRSKTDYVAPFRELTQTLRGVYGEMLINSPSLNDNARRDWFKIDSASIELRNIIVEFLRRLHKYRYTASRAFNAKENDKSKEKLIKAYSDLAEGYNPEEFINEFYKQKDSTKKDKEIVFEFAEEDIPRSPITIKRFYERVAYLLRLYYLETENLQDFLKVRAFLKKHLNQETRD